MGAQTIKLWASRVAHRVIEFGFFLIYNIVLMDKNTVGWILIFVAVFGALFSLVSMAWILVGVFGLVFLLAVGLVIWSSQAISKRTRRRTR